MGSSIFATSNTRVNNLKINLGREVFCSILGHQNFEKILSSFLSLIPFEEYTSSERSKEMHVHIDSKENEKILGYIKIKHLGV